MKNTYRLIVQHPTQLDKQAISMISQQLGLGSPDECSDTYATWNSYLINPAYFYSQQGSNTSNAPSKFKLLSSFQEILDYSQLDLALLPSESRLSNYKLIVFDMDSTLISIECIDEIADVIGKKKEISLLTENAMQGTIDYKESLHQRLSILIGTPASALEEVYSTRLKLSQGAERLIKKVKQVGLSAILVSGGFTFFSERIKNHLSLDAAYANELEIRDGLITGTLLGEIISPNRKKEIVLETCQSIHCSTDQTIVVGDGANDLEMMSTNGISVAFHAKKIVREKASHSIQFCPIDSLLNWFPDSLLLD